MLKIEGQVAFFGTVYFSPGTRAGSDHEINLKHNTIGLNFLDFNRILF